MQNGAEKLGYWTSLVANLTLDISRGSVATVFRVWCDL